MFVSEGGFASDAYDCFVIGSGPAGVSLALALAEAKKKVLIFESGDEQRVRGELANSIGYGHYSGEYWNAHSIRALGGSSNVWTGWCPTPRNLDLDNPAVGVRWPIRRSELMPYPGGGPLRSSTTIPRSSTSRRPLPPASFTGRSPQHCRCGSAASTCRR